MRPINLVVQERRIALPFRRRVRTVVWGMPCWNIMRWDLEQEFRIRDGRANRIRQMEDSVSPMVIASSGVKCSSHINW